MRNKKWTGLCKLSLYRKNSILFQTSERRARVKRSGYKNLKITETCEEKI